mmetsp:Transcript_1521/g.4602  ORF Transcript_1521/g.4602 Transcript_1521/m.4602 type:complete len:210 (+) Transcript_1521:441-1070(+)
MIPQPPPPRSQAAAATASHARRAWGECQARAARAAGCPPSSRPSWHGCWSTTRRWATRRRAPSCRASSSSQSRRRRRHSRRPGSHRASRVVERPTRPSRSSRRAPRGGGGRWGTSRSCAGRETSRRHARWSSIAATRRCSRRPPARPRSSSAAGSGGGRSVACASCPCGGATSGARVAATEGTWPTCATGSRRRWSAQRGAATDAKSAS